MNNYILQDENAVYYECNYSCDNQLFLKLGKESFFITDGRYEIEAKLFTKNCEVFITNDLVKVARKLLKKAHIKKLYFNPYDFNVATFQNLSHSLDIKFIPKEHFSKLKRIIKTNSEIKLLKKASMLGKDGFKRFAQYLLEDGKFQSEQFLQFKAKQYLSDNGKYQLSFDPIVAINKNSAKPHALPTKQKLHQNDMILVDAGIKYKRYCSDRTATSHFNNISFKRDQSFSSKKLQKIYNIVYKAQQKAIEKARVGMMAKEIDKIARDVITKAGFGNYFVHSTGHGVGLDIHEYPVISSRSDTIIEENMVFTIEPGIYLPNKYGVRIEDTIMMKNHKAVVL